MAGSFREVTSPAASSQGAEAAMAEALTQLARMLGRQAAHETIEAANLSRPGAQEDGDV